MTSSVPDTAHVRNWGGGAVEHGALALPAVEIVDQGALDVNVSGH
jgi:hypothetical protein